MPVRTRFAIWVVVVVAAVGLNIARLVVMTRFGVGVYAWMGLASVGLLAAMVALLVTTPAGAIKLPTRASLWIVVLGTLLTPLAFWGSLTPFMNAGWSVRESWEISGFAGAAGMVALIVGGLALVWGTIIVQALPRAAVYRGRLPAPRADRSPWWAVPVLWFPYELTILIPELLGTPIDEPRMQAGTATSVFVVIALCWWHMRTAPVEQPDIPGPAVTGGAFGSWHAARVDYVFWWLVLVGTAAIPAAVGVRF